jgi:hypothetical protein
MSTSNATAALPLAQSLVSLVIPLIELKMAVKIREVSKVESAGARDAHICVRIFYLSLSDLRATLLCRLIFPHGR